MAFASITQLRLVCDRMAGADAHRVERDFIAALGWLVVRQERGDRWRPSGVGAWQALPGATRQFERAIRLAWRINPQLTYSVDATAPELGIDVDLHFGGHTFRGTHNDVAVAACRALLAYAIALQEQQAGAA